MITQDLFNKLNDKQKLAVQSIEGPVMVVAGPGTGKTQVLALRIAYILENTDTPPDAILALTFSDSGRQAMRKRLVDIIGTNGYYVRIETFHSFCDGVIKNNPGYFELAGDEYQVLDDLDRHLLITKVLANGEYPKLRPIKNPDSYVREISRSISDLKKEGYNPVKFRLKLDAIDWEKEDQFEKMKELAGVYEDFENLLKLSKRYDFDDMIGAVVKEFEQNQELLKSFQEKLLYLLADEYQDTNTSQNQVLFKLAEFWGDKANLFVVGDPDQSIYRFQGASLENTLEFKKKFPDCLTVFLDQNYRSQQMILDGASNVIKNNELRSEVLVGNNWNLTANSNHRSRPIELVQLTNDSSEKGFIVSKINDLINDGVQLGEIAVIYRTNSEGREIANLLDAKDIPYEYSDKNVIKNLAVEYLIIILRSIKNHQSKIEEVDLFKYLVLPIWEHDFIEFVKLNRNSHKNKSSLEYEIERSSDLNLKFNLRLLDQWAIRENQVALDVFVKEVIKQSGLIKWIEAQPNPLEYISALRAFITFIERKIDSNKEIALFQLLEALDLYAKYNLSLAPIDLATPRQSVQLLTAHKSKGLEFEVVFITKAVDGVWGRRRNRDLIKLPDELLQNPIAKSEKDEDERRLFYVAMTRAKNQLLITMADEYGDKKSVPAVFVNEIEKSFVNQINTEEYEKLTNEVSFQKMWLAVPDNQKIKEKEFLAEIIEKEFCMSFSAFQAYLDCPHQFKLKYLWKIPDESNDAMLFGTIMHRVFELYFKNNIEIEIAEEKLLDLLPEVVEKHLPRHPKKSQWINEATQIIKVAVKTYLPELKTPAKIEWFVGGVYNPVIWEGIKLQGKIDRVDWINEKLSEIRIVDYKTTQHSSRNALLGETQNHEVVAYLDQMRYYSLMINADKRNIYKPKEMELCFLSPTKTKNPTIKYERFEIVEDEKMKTLKEQILEVWEGIKRLDFEHKDGCGCER